MRARRQGEDEERKRRGRGGREERGWRGGDKGSNRGKIEED